MSLIGWFQDKQCVHQNCPTSVTQAFLTLSTEQKYHFLLLHHLISEVKQKQKQQQAAVVEMATTVAALQVLTSGGFVKADAHKEILYKTSTVSFLPFRRTQRAARMARFQPQAGGPPTPSDLSSKVSESIGKAEQTCAEDPASGECVAAWDEVEELSAAASHARDRLKSTDPLEEYCKDNPETDECRTYED